jgi:hypothetical protein
VCEKAETHSNHHGLELYAMWANRNPGQLQQLRDTGLSFPSLPIVQVLECDGYRHLRGVRISHAMDLPSLHLD